MSVHERKNAKGIVTFEVMFRTAQHNAKCRLKGCARTVHQRSRTFDNRREAERYNQQMLNGEAANRAMGVIVAPVPARADDTVTTFAQAALVVIKRNVDRGKWSAGTGTGMRTALRKLGAWAELPITDAATDLRGAQAIVDTIKYPDRPISLIKATMDYAVREGDITAHGMSALEANRSRIPDERREFIFTTDEQLWSIAGALGRWRHGLGLSILLMRWCGLRTGEALAVEVRDFRDGFKMLTIARQIDVDGRTTTLKGKRAGITREVPVPSALAKRIAAYVADQGITGAVRLFAGPRGGKINRDDFNSKCKAAALAAGLSEAWVPYQCRHQYASDLISRRVPIDRVARLLGHASTTVTYRTYSHWMPDEFDDVRAVLDAI